MDSGVGFARQRGKAISPGVAPVRMGADRANPPFEMPIQIVLNARVPVKIWTDEVGPEAMAQLKNTAALPFVFRHVAAMPDVHLGKGATVGSVVATKGAICPAAVGVDIGCGMAARKTSFRADRLRVADLKKLRASIEREIPVGRESRRQPFESASAWMKKRGRPNASRDDAALADRALHQLGTLGGGNHFIEICVDSDDGMLWVLLHSGSRNVGKTVAERHIGRAKGAMKRLAESLPDPDLAYFAAGTREFDEYRQDLEWCQDYARKNRDIMMDRVLRQLASRSVSTATSPTSASRCRSTATTTTSRTRCTSGSGSS